MKLFKKSIKIAFVAFAVSTVLLSCKKKEIEQPKLETIGTVNIVDLKTYMAQLINVKIDDIVYNERTGQFSIFGVDQISRKQLTEFYQVSKK